MISSTCSFLPLFSAIALLFPAAAEGKTIDSNTPEQVASLENQHLRLVFDGSRGTYSLINKATGITCLSDAQVAINHWKSGDTGYSKSWQIKPIDGTFGKGTELELTMAGDQRPQLHFLFTLYPDHGFVVVRGGITNTLEEPIQIKEIHAALGARMHPGNDIYDGFAMIDGFSGGEPLEYGERSYSPLTRRNALQSRNNALLTFTNDTGRHTTVMGGLTYSDFEKFAHIGQPRRTGLAKGADGKSSLLAYLNLPTDTSDTSDTGLTIKVGQASGSRTWDNHEFRCLETATSIQSPESATFEVTGVDPNKPLSLGLSWWNGYRHGQKPDNTQSVLVEFPHQGSSKRMALIENRRLPRFDAHSKEDVEQVEWKVPTEATRAGQFKVIVTKADATEKDRNVYLSELWIRDGSSEPLLPAQFTFVDNSPCPRIAYSAHLFARDPVGKRVDPGTRYLPDDQFYIDVSEADPFVALEDYGRNVAVAQDINLAMYDFPTVCLWYAAADKFGGGSAENTSVGAVNEMRVIKESGFLNFSRAAVRLVPDAYQPNNQQGWWDDAHWQKEATSNLSTQGGRYLEPYETSEKWGNAVSKLGGIPLTYFQTAYRSEDYAKQFPGHMLFNQTYAWKGKPVDTEGPMFTDWNNTWRKNGSIVWGYDFTDPEFLAHYKDVFAKLKKGNIKGLMFDYPATGWARAGGMEDAYSTTAAAYRTIFQTPHDGLGPGAYVHERNMERGSDVTIGAVASMRTENDTDVMDHSTVTRCGLRWYKNRMMVNLDTDSKDIAALQSNRDAVRAVLTMMHVVSGRLLLANGFSQFTPETFHDLTRTFPYPTEHRSARPVDAFVSPRPMVYHFPVTDDWHQVTFYNPDPKQPKTIGIHLTGDPVTGSLALDSSADYIAYDFWNDRLAGQFSGADRIEQQLRPGEARMISVRKRLDRPQVISTNRHLMQGYHDLISCTWDPATRTLHGISKVVSNDPYTITIASNGFTSTAGSADDDVQSKLTTLSNGLLRLTLESPTNRNASWSVTFAE